MKKPQKRHKRVSKKGKVFEAGHGVGHVDHMAVSITKRKGMLGPKVKGFAKRAGKEMLNAAKIVASEVFVAGGAAAAGTYVTMMAQGKAPRKAAVAALQAGAVTGAGAAGAELFTHYTKRMLGKI